MSTYYDEATHKITTAYSACMSDMKDRLRASTKSYFHVYEKLVDHGYERMSSLYVRFLDGTAETAERARVRHRGESEPEQAERRHHRDGRAEHRIDRTKAAPAERAADGEPHHAADATTH